jgi:hypothetical protein
MECGLKILAKTCIGEADKLDHYVLRLSCMSRVNMRSSRGRCRGAMRVCCPYRC